MARRCLRVGNLIRATGRIIRVLSYPKLSRYIKSDEAFALVNVLTSNADIQENLPDITTSSDADDNRILATAVAGCCDYLITGDKADLLVLEQVENVKIVTAYQLLEMLKITSPS